MSELPPLQPGSSSGRHRLADGGPKIVHPPSLHFGGQAGQFINGRPCHLGFGNMKACHVYPMKSFLFHRCEMRQRIIFHYG